MNLPPPPDRWDIEQINSDRIHAIEAFGFTERQARFLVTVMLHAGVFVERQYCAFANIVHGQKTHDFVRKLIAGKFASMIAVGPLHRGRLIHVQHKRLYAAIGQVDKQEPTCVRIMRNIAATGVPLMRQLACGVRVRSL
jgi:hypothetical protein